VETTEVRGIRIERATAGGFLGGMIFLVKFFFTNERMVPPGIPMKARDSAALGRYPAALAQMLGQGFLAEMAVSALAAWTRANRCSETTRRGTPTRASCVRGSAATGSC